MNSTYFRPQPELFGLRVVKYIRCSHDGQVLHGDTLEAQDALLDEFIKVNHMILVDTFVDEALTARKKFTRRKEFVRLLDGVRAHNFDMILFTKLDRCSRFISTAMVHALLCIRRCRTCSGVFSFCLLLP